MKTVIAATVAAFILAGATGASARNVEKVQVRVSTAGVNFNDPASVNRFRSRLASEVAAACNPDDRISTSATPDFACRKSMTVNAEKRIAMIQSGKPNARMATLED